MEALAEPLPGVDMLRNRIAVSCALLAWGTPSPAAPARPPAIVLVYATAETSDSAEVVWNTDLASDSLVRYSIHNPIPADAPRVQAPAPVTVHQVPLTGLMPGSLYHYEVTSCTKRGCSSATGTFETYPSCPDLVPPVSGSWQRVFSPNVDGSTALHNELLGVDFVSEDEAWAVGWSQDPAGPPYFKRTLTQFFDGRAWRLVPSPNPASDVQSVLYGVSGAAAHDVWAVGSSHDGTLPSRTLIEHWDGRAWTIVPSPSPDVQLNELRAVAALSATDVWAVGYRGGTRPETPLETLVLHWDGVAWTVVPSPNVDGGANQLFAVAAISERDVYAVGSAGGAPLAMQWDGRDWRITPVDVTSGLSTERLTGVAGASPFDLWAVGDGRGIFSNQVFATVHRWNGKRWTARVCHAGSASNPPDGYEGGGPDAYFTGISAAAADDVWAVGVRGSGPMILHWDGAAWTRVLHPRAYPDAAALRAVAVSSQGVAWAVGLEIEVAGDGSTSPQRTLIDGYVP